ncbi:hypothetical protein BC940DRAFT_318325 [Gongronella butleri]|nr:hypothetical protein BC940DRAFT_318325 [Gongronella butleri]
MMKIQSIRPYRTTAVAASYCSLKTQQDEDMVVQELYDDLYNSNTPYDPSVVVTDDLRLGLFLLGKTAAYDDDDLLDHWWAIRYNLETQRHAERVEHSLRRHFGLSFGVGDNLATNVSFPVFPSFFLCFACSPSSVLVLALVSSRPCPCPVLFIHNAHQILLHSFRVWSFFGPYLSGGGRVIIAILQ